MKIVVATGRDCESASWINNIKADRYNCNFQYYEDWDEKAYSVETYGMATVTEKALRSNCVVFVFTTRSTIWLIA